MPSSDAPHDYIRRPRRFVYRGLSLTPQDDLSDGKVSYIRNMRSYMEGTLTVRGGCVPAISGLPGPIHTLARLNDSTPAGGNARVRFIGSGDGISLANVGSSSASLTDSGYSGDPLNSVVAAPALATRPYTYFGDRARQRKINTDGSVYPLGINAPADPPVATVLAPQRTPLQVLDDIAWVGYGGSTTPGTGPVPTVVRVDTIVTQSLLDDALPGVCNFSLESFDNVIAGMLLTIDDEEVLVQSIHPPVSAVTIAAILYDVGSSGWCCIQPDGGFEAGQTEPVEDEVIRHRYANLTTPIPPRTTVTRTIDFPVNSLVEISGEIVRIESVSAGTDGVMSFRCRTSATHAPGETITGIPSLRAYIAMGHGPGAGCAAISRSVTVTAPSATEPIVGGVQAFIGPPANFGRIGVRASAPDDLIRVQIRLSQMGYVEAVRLMLDLQPDPEADDEPFIKNYFFYEWRASDLVAAIQAQTENATSSIIDAQTIAVTRGGTQTQYIDQYGNASGPTVLPPTATPTSGHHVRNPGTGAVSPTAERTGRYALNRDGSVPMSHGLSRQLALGNDVWILLECRVSDLTRVGTDTTLTLKSIENLALYFQSKGWVEPMIFEVGDMYITGGYGPDAGVTLAPYVYRYRYRSTETGERGNVSPPMRAGVAPRRQRVHVSMTSSTAPQVDVIDLYRFGGALARWTYVGTVGNGSPSYNDDVADVQIDGGEGVELDRYACWPIADVPHAGFCRVVGTSVERISGDAFDTRWGADSLITINNRTTTLYAPPSSSSRLELAESVGDAASVQFYLPSPVLLQQPLPILWGGAFNNVWVNFGCGAAQDPGVLYWTHGNDPDASSDTFFLRVTTASEPLMGGYFEDGACFVFSTNRLFRVVPTFGDPLAAFRVVDTACTKGLWARWGLAVSPHGTFFVAADGIYLTQGGSEARPISDPDLSVLFPQDGMGDPQTIRGIVPPDFTAVKSLRLAWVDTYLYFDYQDIDGGYRTLLYEPLYTRWSYDEYPSSFSGVRVRLQEPGDAVRQHLYGSGTGIVYDVEATQISDDLEDLPWDVWTPWEHGDDPRANKQWGDFILDAHPGGSLAGITCRPVTANGLLLHVPTIVGIEGGNRDTFTVEINDGIGPWARNAGLRISGVCESCDIQKPILYLWEPAFLLKGHIVARRATDWDDLGYKGAKFVQGIVIRANTFAEDKCLAVEYDSPNGFPQQALILTLNHDGEQTLAYPLAASGWDPFAAELVRLRGVDDTDWTLHDWRWVWEPLPEAATQWETQETTFDFPGYMTVHDGVVTYASPVAASLRIWHDEKFEDYVLPATASGIYERVYVRFRSAKGKCVRFRLTAPQPLRLFKRDCSVRVQAWGALGGYSLQMPFGGPHRADGAGI